jgi:hypothetical protein
MLKSMKAVLAMAMMGIFATQSAQAAVYINGFETDTAGWTNATRVPSGTNGITSAGGSFHATTGTTVSGQPAGLTAFTTWGGYNFGAGNAVPTAFQEYTTSIDIFLDVAAGLANDTRFDFSSAINNALGTHLSDFIFNGGYYNSSDMTGPGAGTNRFIISASNNSQPGSAFAKNPARSPVAISNTGWYTFEHNFYDNGGVLAVDMSILDSTNTLVGSWTLSNPLHLIGGVGGNRYGWFDYNQIPGLAFDNAELRTADAGVVPEAGSLAIWGGILTLGAVFGWRRSRDC